MPQDQCTASSIHKPRKAPSSCVLAFECPVGPDDLAVNFAWDVIVKEREEWSGVEKENDHIRWRKDTCSVINTSFMNGHGYE